MENVIDLNAFEEILDLYSSGETMQYIAGQMNISLASVEGIILELLEEDEDIFDEGKNYA